MTARLIGRLRGGKCAIEVRVSEPTAVTYVTACGQPNGHRGPHRAYYTTRSGLIGSVQWGDR